MMVASEYLPYKKLAGMASWIVLGANILGAGIVTIYLGFISPISSVEKMFKFETWQYLTYTSAGTVALLVLGTYLSMRSTRYFPEWYEKLRAGEPYVNMPENARREVLKFPISSAATSFLMWVMAGVFFSMGLTGTLSQFFQITLVGGVFTTVIIFFTMDLFWRRVVLLFFPDGKVSATRAYNPPIFLRLLTVFLLTSLYPMGLLVVLSLDRAHQIANSSNPQALLQNLFISEIFLLAIALLASVLMAYLINRTIVDPLMDLKQTMSRVAQNDLTVFVPVTSNDEIGYLGEQFNGMVAGLRQRELLRNLLNMYVSPEVAHEALEHGTPLGGQVVVCSILFSDIRGFTSLSEQLMADELIDLLNRYMTTMVDVIVSHGGMVNKFGGDSLLAVFGTPLNPARDHALLAVRAALSMRDALSRFNKIQRGRGGSELQIGIGIASGPVVAGNIGGVDRIEYTVIGDTVNLASRLQSITKDVGRDILISDAARMLISNQVNVLFDELPSLSVRGKKEPVKMYAIKS